jgi:ABC-type multidrug transport system fused ATPase/permease subunit
MDLRHLLGYAAPYRWPLALTACLMLLEAMATLAIPWLGGQLAAGVLLDGGADHRLVLAGLLVAFAGQALLRFTNGYISGRTAQRLLADLRMRVYDHLQALPLSFHQARRQGETLALVTWEVAQLSSFISGTLLSILPLLLTVAGAVFLMFRLDPLLAVLVAGLVPLFYLALKLLGRRLRGLAVELQRSNARAVGIAEENLSMLPAIKTFTREALESERYGREIAQVMQLSITQQRIHAALEPTIHFLAGTAAVLLLWLGSQRLGGDGMTPAELVSFLLYAALLTRPVSALAGIYGQVQTARGTLARLHDVLTEPAEPIFHPAPALGRVKGAVTFERVAFAYPGRAPTLENVDLHIPAGATVALCGANGAGKSTLVHLLMRLFEPSSGRILIDGIDIATVNLQSLRQKIGVVPQHTLLCNGTVAENIGFGRPDADQAAIEHAARMAQAHDFVIRLPDGYATLIGDQGLRLSGGQRQRLALARALLKDPPILILDEATSMFDLEGERAFIEGAAEALARRTVIVITHRPASLALADRALLVEAGRVRELPRPLPQAIPA